MDDKLESFFNKVNFNSDYYKYFDGATVIQVVVKNKENRWDIYLGLKKQIPINIFEELVKCSKSIEDVDKIHFVFNIENIDNDYLNDYFLYMFRKISEDCPTLASIFDNDIVVEDNKIVVEVINKAEENKFKSIKKRLENNLLDLGFKDLKITTKLNEEKREEVKKLLRKKDIVKKINPEEVEKVIFGNSISGKKTILKDIISEENNVIIEVYLFNIDFKKTRTNSYILNLKVSDNTDSILCKCFIRDENVVFSLQKSLKENSWYRIQGYVKHDDYVRDLVLNIRDIETINKKEDKRVDKETNKRVELHLHTKMSGMDGLIDYDSKLFKHISSLGHRAVGVTDKNTVQEFPKLYNNKNNIKVLYGSEIYVVNDDIDVLIRGNNNLLSETEFVVFDFETTGLNAMNGDTIIEIGAVKMLKGEIIDTYNELIDPGIKLDKIITKITNITDDMLKGKAKEEDAFKRFKEWYKDSVMVAHNAKFDCSFVESCYKKYDLGEFKNPVIDTMELDKVLNPEVFRHSLSACVKRYNVEFDEEGHHRADYDAKGTAILLHKMLQTVDSSFQTINDLNRLVDKNIIHKISKPFHITLFAKNKVGLKNLYKIVTLANTKYLYKTPRILKSEVEKYREGLLIGSGCINGEIFSEAKKLEEEELSNLMKFYDFIEVNPPSICTHLIETRDFENKEQLIDNIKKIITTAVKSKKIVCATGDVHTLNPEDNIYREILVRQKVPGGGLHQLNKKNIQTIPNAYYMTTDEMLNEFSFLDEKQREEIVITNTNKIVDMCEDIQILESTLYAPKMKDSAKITKDMVYKNAIDTYGEKLPEIIETRLEKELGGIIGGEYDVIYLIAQRLVEKSNNDGYIVGSRGSVGSSLVATFMGITEVNPLPPHYVCPKCKKSLFEIDGEVLNIKYGSGFDLPDKVCECGEKLKKQGQDIPFETFLGFNADKTPDIDLNFSGEYQAKAHDYTKVLFGEKNVYRAGTVTTVATKTAFGFVKGYLEEKNIILRNVEIERLALGITGVKRTTGQHPGGIVVVPDYKDIFDFTPYQYPAENVNAAWYTTHFEYHDIEDNLLKLDILGHDDPTVLKYLADEMKIDINDIPLDDREVMSIFSSPKALGLTKEQLNMEVGTLGVPEFGTNFVIKMLEETKPKTFAELIKISGLSHGTDVWNGNARELILDGVCEFKEIIGCRDDIMNYLITCGIEKGQSFKISEFIRKGKSAKDPETWNKFKDIMKENNVPDWYIGSCEKIKYMFPKAHASAYVTMAFRVAWFKVHHPILYYKVYLSIRQSDFDIMSMKSGKKAVKDRMREILNKGFDATNKEVNILECLKVANEMLLRGFYFENISLEKSDAFMFKLTEDKKGLIPPFIAIDGMGDVAAKKLTAERDLKPFVSVEDLQLRGKVSSNIIGQMRELGVLEDLPESSQLSLF